MPLPNEHSARVRNPGAFQEGSFRRITLGGKGSGVSAIIGKLKGQTTTTTQTYRFDKTKFTAAEAKAWLKKNDIKTIEFEPAKKGE